MPIIEVKNLTKKFDDFVAVDLVVLALVGVTVIALGAYLFNGIEA